MSKKKYSRRKKSNEDSPKIYRISELKGYEPTTRRNFIKNTLKVLGTAGLVSHITGCGSDESQYDAHFDERTGKCTCHMVCTCGAEEDDKTTKWEREGDKVCTCNLVCTCNTVSTCTCDSECTCDSQGSHYWYPN